jgi:hypothetical protein
MKLKHFRTEGETIYLQTVMIDKGIKLSRCDHV